MVINRKTISGMMILVLALVAWYAGGEGIAETSSSGGVPETVKLGSLAKSYEPVGFSHEKHSSFADDCASCHHNSPAGETPACGACHPASAGSTKSDAPELKEAYHKQCIDCHNEFGVGPTGCMECHTKKTVVKTTSAPGGKQPKLTVQDGPETCTINSLEKIYQPVEFPHNLHAEMSGDCTECHHHSPAGETPACGGCHGEPFNPKNLNMPGLKGAYHLQCLGCHREMGVGSTGCSGECHIKKTDESG
jgi:hypothetical protein